MWCSQTLGSDLESFCKRSNSTQGSYCRIENCPTAGGVAVTISGMAWNAVGCLPFLILSLSLSFSLSCALINTQHHYIWYVFFSFGYNPRKKNQSAIVFLFLQEISTLPNTAVMVIGAGECTNLTFPYGTETFGFDKSVLTCILPPGVGSRNLVLQQVRNTCNQNI